MNDRTKQIVDLVLKAPELLQSLKADPKALASRCGIPDQAYSLLEAGRDLVEKYTNCRSSGPSDSVIVAKGVSPTMHPRSVCPGTRGQDNTTATVGVVGLASVVGMLSAMAVVAVVSIHKEDS